MQGRSNCAIVFACAGLLTAVSRPAAAAIAPLQPGDLLVGNHMAFREYTPAGTLVQTIDVPVPPGGGTSRPRDSVVTPNGVMHVHTVSDTAHYLSSFNFGTQAWTHRTMPGWGLAGVTYYGSVTADANYVYVPDQLDGTQGVIRFSADGTGSPVRFGTGFEPHVVKVGRDGLIYAANTSSTENVWVFDPATLTNIRKLTLATPDTLYGLTVAANGELLTTSRSGIFQRWSPSGSQLLRVNDPSFEAHEIELAADGTVFLGNGDTRVTRTNTSFSSFTPFTTPAGSGAFSLNYIGFTSPVPEPAAAAAALGLCASLAARRRRENRRGGL